MNIEQRITENTECFAGINAGNALQRVKKKVAALLKTEQ